MIYNEGQFKWRTQHPLCPIPYSIQGRSENPHLTLGGKGLEILYIWSWSVYNEGQLTWWTQHILCTKSYYMQGIFLKIQSGTGWQIPTKCVYLFSMGPLWMAVYMKNTAYSLLYLLFHKLYFPVKPYLELSNKGLQNLHVWFRSVYNEWQFKWWQ